MLYVSTGEFITPPLLVILPMPAAPPMFHTLSPATFDARHYAPDAIANTSADAAMSTLRIYVH